MLYADASALAKLVLAERESAALREHIDEALLTTSALGMTELLRVARRAGPDEEQQAATLLETIALIDVTKRY